MKHRPLSKADLARELQEELDELEQEQTQVIFEQRRRRACAQRRRINATRRQNAEVLTVAQELSAQARKELSLLNDPFIRECMIEDLEQDGEIGDHDVAVVLEQNDELVFSSLAAA